MSTQPTVLVVDDDACVRESLSTLLQSAGFEVGEFEDAQSLLEEIRRRCATGACPGCLIVDLLLPETDAVELLPRIRQAGCHAPVIVATGFGDVTSAVRAMKAGAADFLTKPVDPELLIRRVREAVDAANMARCRERELRGIAERLDSLTRRERQILSRVVQGKVTKEIAEELGISSKTVEVHRSHVTRKMHVRSVAELVRIVTKYELEAEKEV